MRRRVFWTMMIVLVLLSAGQVFAEYNRDQVVKVMQDNVKFMGALKEAVQGEDFFAAAEAFMGLARGSNAIKDFTPRKGQASQWKKFHQDLIKAAFRGIGAVAEEDLEQVNEAFGEIATLNKRGHNLFK